MKTQIKNILLAVALLGSMSSCEDFLTVEPVDKLVQDNYYTDASRIRANTLSLYSAYTWGNYAMNFQWKLDMLSGDMYYTYDQEGQFYFGTFTNGNQYLNEGWKGLYNVISFANSVINDMPEPARSNGVAEADINQGLAEARLIRGWCYYYLAEYWHDAPIIENNSQLIADGNINVPRNKQKDLYRFARADMEFAASVLPETDSETFRVTKWTAYGMLAKLLVTMASHTDYGYDRAALYTEAAGYAKAVMDDSGLTNPKNSDYSTLFDVEANNGDESLFAIQCMVYGYNYGNGRNAAWSRSSVIADQTWGGGKGPSLSLQSIYDPADKRRKWTYMTLGDYYPNLAKASGGYTYYYVNRADDGSTTEDRNEMNAHIKKYVIGKAADCDGNVGLAQDAANNIYLLRLADVYLLYAEAVMGVNSSTTDQKALDAVNTIRERAGLAGWTSMTYYDLMAERRREFAFESINWFDILRLRYREGDQVALQYLNDGCNTGINRAAMYVQKAGVSQSEENLASSYEMVQTKADGAMYDPITLSASCFELFVPASVETGSPILGQDPVDYYND